MTYQNETGRSFEAPRGERITPSDPASDTAYQWAHQLLSKPPDLVISEADLANKKATNWVLERLNPSQPISRSENDTPSDLHI